MKLKQLATPSNLELAWRRITTGGNHQYKRYFRPLYVAYEVALDANLADLRKRLEGGSLTPRQPERVYLPKASGLHRPVRLLHIEDHIVLQASANLAAKKLYPRRQPLQFKVVFSNILQSDSSVFFFKRWQDTYTSFQRRIHRHYDAGLRWVGDFDLAAFDDTVSHDLLLKTIYPRTPSNRDMDWLHRSMVGPGVRCFADSSCKFAPQQHPVRPARPLPSASSTLNSNADRTKSGCRRQPAQSGEPGAAAHRRSGAQRRRRVALGLDARRGQRYTGLVGVGSDVCGRHDRGDHRWPSAIDPAVSDVAFTTVWPVLESHPGGQGPKQTMEWRGREAMTKGLIGDDQGRHDFVPHARGAA